MRPVSPQADFGDSLMSWRNPSFLAPLGHLVSADAPAGVIHRLIEPVAPPITRPAGAALEVAPPVAGRPTSSSVVQRMLATLTPWARRESTPAGTEPDRDAATPASAELAPPPSGPPGRTPGGTPLPPPAPASEPSAVQSLPVQRTEAASGSQAPDPAAQAALMKAPAPALPMLELPVLQTGAVPASAEIEPEPDSAAPLPRKAEPGWSVDPPRSTDGHDGEIPTLGMDPPLSATQPVDGGAGGSADVADQERRASAPGVEASGRLTPPTPAVQRADPGTLTPPPVSRGKAVSHEEAGDEKSGASEAGDRTGDEAPTLGVSPPPSVAPQANDIPMVAPAGHAPAVQRAAGDDAVVPPLGTIATAGVAGSARRLGLGPPLTPDAVTAQRSQATSPTKPPIVSPPVVPTGPASPTGSPERHAETPGTGAAEQGAALPVGDVVIPLLGQSAPVLQRHAAGSHTTGSHTSADTTGSQTTGSQTTGSHTTGSDTTTATGLMVQTARDPSPEPPWSLLPQLRVSDPASPSAEASAPARPALPVVARLVGDRTSPLRTATDTDTATATATATGTGTGPTQRDERAQHPPSALLSTAPPGRLGYPDTGAAALPVQLTPSVGPAGPVASAMAQRAPRPRVPGPRAPEPVVQAAPAEEPAPPVPAEPAPLPAQETPPDLGGDVPGEPENLGSAPSAAPAGTPPAGVPATGPAGNPDELVKKLFDPLLRRLKTELRLDRERRGMLTDLRH